MTSVLMYHALSETETDEHYTVPIADFREQMKMLSKSGRTVCTVGEYCTRPVPGAVVVTFDDGHDSDLRLAAPALDEHGFKATFFMTTGWIGSREGWLSWSGVRELANGGMEIGAHGHSHRFLDDLDTLEMKDELERPQRLLADNAGIEVRDLALPGGRYTRETLALASDLGYRSVSTSVPGLNHPSKSDQLTVLNRYAVTRLTDMEVFGRMIDNDRSFARRESLKYRVKVIAKRSLGNRLYQRVWLALRN